MVAPAIDRAVRTPDSAASCDSRARHNGILTVKSGVDPLSRTEAEAKIDHAKGKVDEAIEGPRTPCIGN
jgi:hypothetical protein